MTREEKINTLKAIIQECEEYQRQRKETLFEIIGALEQEPCEAVAKERYEDLCEYFGGAKDILKHREDFKAWLGRVKWHIHKAEELSAENDDLRDQLAMRDRFQKQEPVLDKIRAEIENHCGLLKENHCKYCPYCTCVIGVREILEIIDKYKAESEE